MCTVNPLLIPPRGGLVISNTFEGWGRLFDNAGLFNLANKMVSVLHKELECKVEKLKYKKMEVMQQRIKKLVTYFTHKPTERNYLRRIPNHHELLLPKLCSPIPLLLPFHHFLVIP